MSTSAVGFVGVFGPHGTGPGYTVSNTPAPVEAAPGFSLPQPFETNLPAGLKQHYFATAQTAAIIAMLTGATARQETGTNPGAGVNAWFIDFKDPDGTLLHSWNAGDLYLYLQSHSGFTVPA